jgi:hypothetical protein
VFSPYHILLRRQIVLPLDSQLAFFAGFLLHLQPVQVQGTVQYGLDPLQVFKRRKICCVVSVLGYGVDESSPLAVGAVQERYWQAP